MLKVQGVPRGVSRSGHSLGNYTDLTVGSVCGFYLADGKRHAITRMVDRHTADVATITTNRLRLVGAKRLKDVT